MSQRHERIERELQRLAAAFLEHESNRTSLVTVTGVSLSPDQKAATVYFTVFPQEKERAALEFARRRRGEFRDYVRDNLATLKTIPRFEFAIDSGEHHRQRVDALLDE